MVVAGGPPNHKVDLDLIHHSSPHRHTSTPSHEILLMKDIVHAMNTIACVFLWVRMTCCVSDAFQAHSYTSFGATRDRNAVITESNMLPINRRDYVALIASTVIVALPTLSDAVNTTTILKGVVTLKPGTQAITSTGSALYVTAKPETTINAPKAIAEAFAGRPPPVLTARYPISSGSSAFPFDFQFTESDITAEGLYEDANAEKKANRCWWMNDNLVISARFDSDGVAATRDPDDLVGRSFSLVERKENDNTFRYNSKVEIQLQGRGVGGRFITTKKEK